MTALGQSGMYENTVFIFVGDNGGSPKDGGYNYPLRGTKGRKFSRVQYFFVILLRLNHTAPVHLEGGALAIQTRARLLPALKGGMRAV